MREVKALQQEVAVTAAVPMGVAHLEAVVGMADEVGKEA